MAEEIVDGVFRRKLSVRKLREYDMRFKEKYPKLYSNFDFNKKLFAEIEKRVMDTVIRENGFPPLAPAWVEKSLVADLVIIVFLKDYAEDLEGLCYYISGTGRKVQIDEIMFHEFLHVLGEFKPWLFKPSPIIIDLAPFWLTHMDPPKTVDELKRRIRKINVEWQKR